MSATSGLLQTIEPDEDVAVPAPPPSGNINASSKTPAVVLTPTNRGSDQMATNHGDAESGEYFNTPLFKTTETNLHCLAGIAGIFRQVKDRVSALLRL